MKRMAWKAVQRKRWISFAVVTILYLLFLWWVKSLMGLIIVPFIFDAYITQIIPWGWWKQLPNARLRNLMSWVDAIIFALVAVYFVHLFAFQPYAIPSSSLEKSLLTGDYLFVSKVSYGPRIPNTPLSMPLVQHTLPILNCKSYIEKPQWEYRRVKGLGDVQLNDIVVFNFPAGDTVVSNANYQAANFYALCYDLGYQLYPNKIAMDSLSYAEQRIVYNFYYQAGRAYIDNHPEEFGKVMSRPVDRRENYVKRCVGMPGQTLEIRNKVVYLDGMANKEPDNVQYSYILQTVKPITEEFLRDLDIANDDIYPMNREWTRYHIFLSEHTKQKLLARKDWVQSVEAIAPQSDGVYPQNLHTQWTSDNYGPIWIPKRGETIELTQENLPIYERPIRIYEGNDLRLQDGVILINGEPTTHYTFKMDYYWMMGDNRHNSLDSRYWGFVPEDHIVGKPIVVWLSLDKDRSLFKGKIRWNRFFKLVDNIK